MNVYELTKEAEALLAEGQDGFDTDEELAEWEARLAAFAEASGDKFAALRHAKMRAEANAEYLREQAKAIAERASRREATVSRIHGMIEGLLRAHVAATGQAKVETRDGSWIALRSRKSVSVQVDDPAVLPDDLRRVRIEGDKVAIKAAIVAGRDVPGALLIESVSEFVAFGK